MKSADDYAWAVPFNDHLSDRVARVSKTILAVVQIYSRITNLLSIDLSQRTYTCESRVCIYELTKSLCCF